MKCAASEEFRCISNQATNDGRDDGGGTNTISLEGADQAAFEVDAGSLYLKAGVSLANAKASLHENTNTAVAIKVADILIVD